jgi:hypothetical protein
VSKDRFDTLDDALAHLSTQVTAPLEPTRKVLGREYAPSAQVSGRFEVRGPGARGGIDVHGDGSMVAYAGRIRKVIVEPESGESVLDALGRALSS